MKAMTFTLVVAILMPIVATAEEPVKVSLNPGRWTYKAEMVSAKPGFPLNNAEGVMVDLSQQKCEDYVVDQRFSVRLTGNNGQVLIMRSAALTTESLDGLQYAYQSKTMVNDKVVDQRAGSAVLTADGQGGTLKQNLPSKQEIKLPAGTTFPVAQGRFVLESAARGDTSFERTVFDGMTGPTGLNSVTGRIGKGRPVGLEIAKIGMEGMTDIAWPVDTAIYTYGSQAAAPEAQSSFIALPNGTAESMKMDFGDFVLLFTLTKVEPMKAQPCK